MSLRPAGLLAILLLSPAAALCSQGTPAPVLPSLAQPGWQELTFPALPLFRLDTQPVHPQPPAGQKTPEPYTEDEFPQWARDLWRGGVIFFGSLPFTFFFTLEGYDIYRYAANGFNPALAPWPFRSASDIAYSAQEQLWLIVGALTASLLVSGADYLIGIIGENGSGDR